MNKTSKIVSSISLLLILVINCNNPELQNYSGRSDNRVEAENIVRYYSDEKPGKWKDQVKDHVPEYTIEDFNDVKRIRVTVPFSGTLSPPHYVEVIVLADNKHKQIKSVTFEKGVKDPVALFEIPGNYNSDLYIISKCSLHDMWEKKITPNN